MRAFSGIGDEKVTIGIHGVIAATYVGSLVGMDNIISFDMGGTTTKVGLVEKGEAKIAPHFEVGSTAVPMATQQVIQSGVRWWTWSKSARAAEASRGWTRVEP